MNGFAGLVGKRVLVTRAAGQASALADLLRLHGAEPILIPSIELAPPASFCALDAALTTLRSYDWLLFTSANAVHVFAQRARTLNLPAQARRVAVIGPATAAAVLEHNLADQVDLMPQQYVAEAFAEALQPHSPGASMLLVRAAQARDVLPERLAEAGAQVTIAEAYRTIVPQDSVAKLQKLLAEHALHAITFTSASTAQNLAALLAAAGLSLPPHVVLASIGPVTSAAMQAAGFTASVEAREATVPALVESLAEYLRGYKSLL